MIICSCNALSDRCIDGAIKGGARRMSEVYAGLGCSPRCGRCARSIRDKLREAGDVQSLMQQTPANARMVIISLVPERPQAAALAGETA